MDATQTTTALDTPPPMSLRDHIAAEDAPAAPVVDPTPAVEPVVEVSPEQEADSPKPDSDVSDAAKVLRKNRAEERKARIQREIDELKREEYELRDRIARARAQVEPTPAAAPVADPGDPEPREADFDDYSKFVIAQSRWAARQELKAHEQTRARVQRVDAMAQALTTKVDSARSAFADWDAVKDNIAVPLRQGDPRLDRDVSAFIAESPVGEKVLYRLAKDEAARNSVLRASSPVDLLRALTRLELDATVPPAPPKSITSAPPPPRHTVGGGSTSAGPVDTNREGFSTAEHYRIEQAAINERRKSGLR